jgi:hypothetical protein
MELWWFESQLHSDSKTIGVRRLIGQSERAANRVGRMAGSEGFMARWGKIGSEQVRMSKVEVKHVAAQVRITSALVMQRASVRFFKRLR